MVNNVRGLLIIAIFGAIAYYRVTTRGAQTVVVCLKRVSGMLFVGTMPQNCTHIIATSGFGECV